jgi:hypothetical protein
MGISGAGGSGDMGTDSLVAQVDGLIPPILTVIARLVRIMMIFNKFRA